MIIVITIIIIVTIKRLYLSLLKMLASNFLAAGKGMK